MRNNRLRRRPGTGERSRSTGPTGTGRKTSPLAQYRSLDRLKATGGDWDESDTGWWAYVDSDTQKRIEPHGWKSTSADDEDE